jgi:hypothetical protein
LALIDISSQISGKGGLTATILGGYADGDIPAQYLFHLAEASPYIYGLNRWYSARGTLPEKLKDDHHLFLDDGGSLPGFLDQDEIGSKKIALRLNLDLANPIEYLDIPRNFLIREIASISHGLYITHGAVWNGSGFAEAGDFKTEAGLHLSYKIPLWDHFFGDERFHLYMPLMISKPEGDQNNFKLRWVLSIAK